MVTPASINFFCKALLSSTSWENLATFWYCSIPLAASLIKSDCPIGFALKSKTFPFWDIPPKRTPVFSVVSFSNPFNKLNFLLTSGLLGSILLNRLSSILALSKLVLNLLIACGIGFTLIKFTGLAPCLTSSKNWKGTTWSNDKANSGATSFKALENL